MRSRHRIEFPDTYEKLVAFLAGEHPTWTRAQVEQYIVEQQREQERRWAAQRGIRTARDVEEV